MNLGAYYLVGVPVALLMAFVADLKGAGLWCGLIVGATVQSIALSFITGFTNWEKQVKAQTFLEIHRRCYLKKGSLYLGRQLS